MSITEIITSGIEALGEYLSAHVLTCLVPAFFIAGGIAVFVTKQGILKYLDGATKKISSLSALYCLKLNNIRSHYDRKYRKNRIIRVGIIAV